MNHGHSLKPFLFGISTEVNEDNFRSLQPVLILPDQYKFSMLCNSSDELLHNDQEFLCTAQKNDPGNYSKSPPVCRFNNFLF